MQNNNNIPKTWMIALIGLLICFGAQAQNYLYGPEIDNWNEETKQQQRENGKAFIEQLRDARVNGLSEINLEHDHYRFKRSFSDDPGLGHIYIPNLNNVTINGNGAALWFEDYYTAFFMRNCKNVTFKNLNIDYDPVPQSQGEVIEIGANYVVIQTEDKYPTCTEIVNKVGSTKSKFFVFQPDTNLFKRELPHIVARSFSDQGNGKIRINAFAYGGYDLNKLDSLEIGDKACVTFHMGHGIKIRNSYDITFEDVNMYASPQYGIAASNGGGGLKLMNFNIIPRPGTNRLMTCNADGIHTIATDYGPHIENCSLSAMSDDVVNIQSDFDMIQEQVDSNTAKIAIKNFLTIYEGDTLNIYDVHSLNLKHTVKIAELRKSNDPEDLNDAKAIGDEFNASFWAGTNSIIVSFNEKVNLERGDVVEKPTRANNGAYIVNNHMYNSSTRGLLVKARNAYVGGNTIENIGVSGLIINCSIEWFEGPFPEDVVVENNTLRGIGHGLNSRLPGANTLGALCAYAEYYGRLKNGLYNVKNIRIKNNYIEDTPLAGIFITHLDSGYVYGNTIRKYSNGDKGRMGKNLGIEPFAGIYLADSRSVWVEGNNIKDPGYSAETEIKYGPNYIFPDTAAPPKRVDMVFKTIDAHNHQAITDGKVYLNDVWHHANDTGVIELDDILADYYNIRVEAPQYYAIEDTFMHLHQDSTIVFELEPDKRREATITVKDKRTGESLYRAVLHYNNEMLLTNNKGMVTINKAGSLGFTIEKEGYFNYGDTISMKNDTGLTAYLTPNTSDITVQVSDSAGRLFSAQVVVDLYSQATNDQGKVSFYNMPARKEYVIEVSKTGYRSLKDTVYLMSDTLVKVVLVQKSTGITESSLNDLEIYPNPFNHRIFIKHPRGNVKLFIYNVTGQKVREEMLSKGLNQLNVAYLREGIYFLKIYDDGQHACYRFIKN